MRKNLRLRNKSWNQLRSKYKSKYKKPKRKKILAGLRKDFCQVVVLSLRNLKNKKSLNSKSLIRILCKSSKFRKQWKWTTILMKRENNGWTMIFSIKLKLIKKSISFLQIPSIWKLSICLRLIQGKLWSNMEITKSLWKDFNSFAKWWECSFKILLHKAKWKNEEFTIFGINKDHTCFVWVLYYLLVSIFSWKLFLAMKIHNIQLNFREISIVIFQRYIKY